jgi:hypothetical protein
MLNVDDRIHIGMRAVATDDTANVLLVGSVGSVYIMAYAAKGAVVFAVAGVQEVGNAHIHAHHRGRWRGLITMGSAHWWCCQKKKKGCDAY